MCNWELILAIISMPVPKNPTINTCKEVVNINPHIGIKLTIEKNPYIYNRHNNTNRP